MKIEITTNTEFPLIRQLAQEIGKPICILDTETTGLLQDPVVGIVEVAFLAVDLDGNVRSGESMINPGIPIPEGASRVHGIYDKDVAGAHEFDRVMEVVSDIFDTHVISGFNTRSYDISVIQKNYERYGERLDIPGHHLDVRDIWCGYTRTRYGKLNEVAARYKIQPGDAHRAAGDVLTTARILEAMLAKHDMKLIMGNLWTNKIRVPSPSSNNKATVLRNIMEHVEQHGRITFANFESLATKSSCPVSTVSFQVSELFSSGDLQRDQIEDAGMQSLILQHLDAAIQSVGSAQRLKPIKAALDKITGTDIDYVQLKLALTGYSAVPGVLEPGM